MSVPFIQSVIKGDACGVFPDGVLHTTGDSVVLPNLNSEVELWEMTELKVVLLSQGLNADRMVFGPGSIGGTISAVRKLNRVIYRLVRSFQPPDAFFGKESFSISGAECNVEHWIDPAASYNKSKYKFDLDLKTLTVTPHMDVLSSDIGTVISKPVMLFPLRCGISMTPSVTTQGIPALGLIKICNLLGYIPGWQNNLTLQSLSLCSENGVRLGLSNTIPRVLEESVKALWGDAVVVTTGDVLSQDTFIFLNHNNTRESPGLVSCRANVYIACCTMSGLECLTVHASEAFNTAATSGIKARLSIDYSNMMPKEGFSVFFAAFPSIPTYITTFINEKDTDVKTPVRARILDILTTTHELTPDQALFIMSYTIVYLNETTGAVKLYLPSFFRFYKAAAEGGGGGDSGPPSRPQVEQYCSEVKRPYIPFPTEVSDIPSFLTKCATDIAPYAHLSNVKIECIVQTSGFPEAGQGVFAKQSVLKDTVMFIYPGWQYGITTDRIVEHNLHIMYNDIPAHLAATATPLNLSTSGVAKDEDFAVFINEERRQHRAANSCFNNVFQLPADNLPIRVEIIALRDIRENEELTISYGPHHTDWNKPFEAAIQRVRGYSQEEIDFIKTYCFLQRRPNNNFAVFLPNFMQWKVYEAPPEMEEVLHEHDVYSGDSGEEGGGRASPSKRPRDDIGFPLTEELDVEDVQQWSDLLEDPMGTGGGSGLRAQFSILLK